MEEKIFVGYNYGKFEGRDGKMVPYCNAYMLEDHKGEESQDYRYGGQKANKYKCASPDVWAGIKFGDRVMCFYDSYGRISHMQKIDAKA